MALTYLYARLRISLATMALHALFEESDHGLESLSEVLTTVVTETTLSELYADAAAIDLMALSELNSDSPPLLELLTEFRLLTKMIRTIHAEHEFKGLGRLTAIHLELPDTLILEYRSSH